ncbi:hypothetical protein FQA47_020158 [Oryzias melastigma]|uniref:Uncharacterized protein n=1 Tax=Oryzias melastigma TaxID=30732 RepID=A0A834FT81_ORYME|nr:hypothetical protein FQA47_020158 [Oryzias melastigma]
MKEIQLAAPTPSIRSGGRTDSWRRGASLPTRLATFPTRVGNLEPASEETRGYSRFTGHGPRRSSASPRRNLGLGPSP